MTKLTEEEVKELNTIKTVMLIPEDKIFFSHQDENISFSSIIKLYKPMQLPQYILNEIPTNWIKIVEYKNINIEQSQKKFKKENKKKKKELKESKELKPCDAEFKSWNVIPGNIHSESSMICDACGKTTHRAGSCLCGGNDYTICVCCYEKIKNILLNIDERNIPNNYFTIENGLYKKEINFNETAWITTEIEKIRNERKAE